MAYTTADLDTLDRAIASGTLSLQLDGRRVQYRSMQELLQARAHVAQQLADAAAAANGSRRATQRFVFATLRGD